MANENNLKEILIVADMEGCIGVYNLNNYSQSKMLMIKELKCILDFLISKNQYNITLLDCHNEGKNIEDMRNDYPQVKFVNHLWNLKKIHTYGLAILTGFHAQAGKAGLYNHTLRPEIKALKLGDKIIGEIELVVNWLASYSVRTICVAGDEGARDEVESLNICFHSTKSVDDGEIVHPDSYWKLIDAIEVSLEKTQTVSKYDANGIEVVFKNSSYIDFMPRIYDVTENTVKFRDTNEFIANLLMFCKYINMGAEYRIKMIKGISELIKEKSIKQYDLLKISDDVFKRLFYETNPVLLTKSEIEYIKDTIKNGLKEH